MPVNPRKLGLCKQSVAALLELAEADEDDAVLLPLPPAEELEEPWSGYADPRGLTSNG